jgi:hypothetical protein
MTTQGNGQRPLAYQVRWSEQTKILLKQQHLEAAQAGKGHRFIAALRQITERLRTDPLVFGEPQYRLPALKLLVRQAVVGPLVVDYAVHDEKPLVFIRGFKLLG